MKKIMKKLYVVILTLSFVINGFLADANAYTGPRLPVVVFPEGFTLDYRLEIYNKENCKYNAEVDGYDVPDGEDFKFKIHYCTESNQLHPNIFLIDRFGEESSITVEDGWYVVKNVTDYTVVFWLDYRFMTPGWNFDGKNWVYQYEKMVKSGIGKYFVQDSLKCNEWAKIDDKWYYFNEYCIMESDAWIKTNDKWYYVGENGAMLTGWQKIDGLWYYLDYDGAMIKGWKYVDGKRYYLNSCMQTGWQYVDNNWYYLDSYMKTGWQKINNRWYFMHDDGTMASDEWVKTNNKWYYLEKNGAMKTSGIVKGWRITSDGSAEELKY